MADDLSIRIDERVLDELLRGIAIEKRAERLGLTPGQAAVDRPRVLLEAADHEHLIVGVHLDRHLAA